MAARTFAVAQNEIRAALAALGWTIVGGLKIPHATSPDGRHRLWFKPQAIWFTLSTTGRHPFGEARSIDQMGAIDIRQYDAGKVAAWLVRELDRRDR